MISDNSGGWNSYNTHLSLIHVQHESRVEKHVSGMCVLELQFDKKKRGFSLAMMQNIKTQVLKLYAKTSHKCFFFFP